MFRLLLLLERCAMQPYGNVDCKYLKAHFCVLQVNLLRLLCYSIVNHEDFIQ